MDNIEIEERILTHANRTNHISERMGKWMADTIKSYLAAAVVYENAGMEDFANKMREMAEEGTYLLEDVRDMFAYTNQDIVDYAKAYEKLEEKYLEKLAELIKDGLK